MIIRNQFISDILNKLPSNIRILYILVEYSEINITKIANEFLSASQENISNTLKKDQQFAIQITEKDIIDAFIQSGLNEFMKFGSNLQDQLNQQKRKREENHTVSCKCTTGCKTRRCSCNKKGVSCQQSCTCKKCQNKH